MRRLFAAMFVMGSLLGSSFVAQPASAALNPFGDVCRGKASNTTVCEDRGGANRPFSLAETIINLLLFLAGLVSVIMIIIGAIRYVTSGGDAAGVKAAKDTVIYAVIGLIVAMLAYAIVGFVVGRL